MASKDAKRPTPTSRDQSEGVPNPSVTRVSLGSRRRGSRDPSGALEGALSVGLPAALPPAPPRPSASSGKRE